MKADSEGKPWFEPDWPAPANVRACITLRYPGESASPWDAFNLALHVGDDAVRVEANRGLLQASLGLQISPFWLQQCHSNVASLWGEDSTADASFTVTPGQACAVLTADCLPLLVCDRAGSFVAAIHAGWRGLSNGVIENTLANFSGEANDLLVYLGPCISEPCFEIDQPVYEQLLAGFDHRGIPVQDAATCFTPSVKAGHYLASLEAMARLRLQAIGVSAVFGGGMCTYSHPARYYSYRRDGEHTGRIASLVWIKAEGESCV